MGDKFRGIFRRKYPIEDEVQVIDNEEIVENVQDYEEEEEFANISGEEIELEEEDLDDYEESELQVEEDLDDYEESELPIEEDLDDYEESELQEEEDLDDDIQILDVDDENVILNGDDREETEAEKALRKHKRKKRFLITVFSVLGVILLIYLGISVYFMKHFYPYTTVNGTDFSMKTAEDLDVYLEAQVADYQLKLKQSDGKIEYISGDDISLKYLGGDSADKLVASQNPLFWISCFWKTPEIEAPVGVEYDEEKLTEEINSLECVKPENQTPSISAHPEFKDKEFQIVKEEFGTQLDNEKFVKAIKEAISEFLQELDLEEAGCYTLPEFTSEDPEVEEARVKMNSYLGANITLDFFPETEVVDSAVISQWITVDENMAVTFNQEAVRGYIAGLAEKYDTYGKTRTITTGYGTTVQVEGGSYGWQIDQEAEYNALTANIQNAETVTREPNYARRAASHEGNDFGTTYVEIDLTNQHLFFFQNGQCLLETDIVTGNPNKGNGTPQGVYPLAYKQTNQVLRGPKKPDGTYEWESPVSYWMPFNGGIGLHDANWQSAFGGDRYLTYGSHGCVNLPPSVAGTLYGYVEAGMPIVCHY